jgi:hypothetical protein
MSAQGDVSLPTAALILLLVAVVLILLGGTVLVFEASGEPDARLDPVMHEV